jgi:hypothetical protein
MFIRFVAVDDVRENLWLATGIITIANEMRIANKFSQHHSDTLLRSFKWFNDNLPLPPFHENSWGIDAVSWFRVSATRYIEKTEPIISVLRKNNVIVRALCAAYPGRILYRDKYQVVAETPRNKK